MEISFLKRIAFLSVTFALVACSADDTNQSPHGSSGASGASGSSGSGSGGGPAEGECLHLAPLRVWVTEPAAVALLFSAEDCATGVPKTGLTNADFTVLEDSETLSSEAHRDILTDRGYRVEVDLLLDVSDSTLPTRDQIVGGAKAFVNEVMVTRDLSSKVTIGIWAFDGSESIVPIQYPVSDTDRVLQKLDSIKSWAATDGGATNLNGALRQGVSSLQDRLVSLMVDNAGGIAATGHVIVFTDGGDSAQREDPSGAKSAIESARQLVGGGTTSSPSAVVQTWAVTLKGDDYDEDAIRELIGPERYILEASTASELQTKFEKVGGQIGSQVQGTYLFAYCSSKRSGSHDVSLGLKDGIVPQTDSVTLEFSAEGFGGGCNADFFTNACEDKECGGLACGACDAESELCNTSSLQCKPL